MDGRLRDKAAAERLFPVAFARSLAGGRYFAHLDRRIGANPEEARLVRLDEL
jgi:hypothetical protein